MGDGLLKLTQLLKSFLSSIKAFGFIKTKRFAPAIKRDSAVTVSQRIPLSSAEPNLESSIQASLALQLQIGALMQAIGICKLLSPFKAACLSCSIIDIEYSIPNPNAADVGSIII